MKTDDLIAILATGAGPAPRAVAARRLLPAALAGIAASIALTVLTLGLLPDFKALASALTVKLVYATSLAAGAAWLCARLARPAARAQGAVAVVGGILFAMAIAGGATLLATPEAERLPFLMGQSWGRCPWAVLSLSLPALAAALWALRGLAPTRPLAAGLAAGLLAGSIGAFGYAFACTEQSTAFIALWYTLGIAMTGGLGAVLGPLTLRW